MATASVPTRQVHYQADNAYTALDARTSAHLRPLDSVICALEETPCTWCQGLLRPLQQHIEEQSVPAFGWEVLN